MSECGDCIHSEICASHLKAVRGIYGAAMSISGREVNRLESALSEISITIGQICCDDCDHFQDRSRFVELPCKVGDCLYALLPKSNAVVEYVVIAFWIEESGVIIRVVDTRFFTTTIFFIKDIGTKVFLTKQKAEQALKEREAT